MQADPASVHRLPSGRLQLRALDVQAVVDGSVVVLCSYAVNQGSSRKGPQFAYVIAVFRPSADAPEELVFEGSAHLDYTTVSIVVI